MGNRNVSSQGGFCSMRAFGGGGGSQQPAAQKIDRDEVVRQMRQQGDLQIAQGYVQFSTKLCLKKCVKKPDARFSAHERKCIDTCVARFLDGNAIVADTYKDYRDNLNLE